MDNNDPFSPNLPAPTANRPLLGLTVLVIEDSKFACEAMRLLCLRSGARIRRADSLRSARRHLQVYRPSVAIIDLGLPDGSGEDLIKDLVEDTSRPLIVLGTSGDPHSRDTAMTAGADGFLAKPIRTRASIILHRERRLIGRYGGIISSTQCMQKGRSRAGSTRWPPKLPDLELLTKKKLPRLRSVRRICSLAVS